jgi:hypothetical protein
MKQIFTLLVLAVLSTFSLNAQSMKLSKTIPAQQTLQLIAGALMVPPLPPPMYNKHAWCNKHEEFATQFA